MRMIGAEILRRTWAKCCGSSIDTPRPSAYGPRPARSMPTIDCSRRRVNACKPRRNDRMRRLIGSIACCAVLAGCVGMRPALTPAPWDQRLADLQRSRAWQLDGRAAVALGKQGWQASLDWRQRGAASEVHLSGPFGAGALVLKVTPAGLSLNGAPPSDAVVAQLQDRLGFELPLDNLRYWLLGVPDPSGTF